MERLAKFAGHHGRRDEGRLALEGDAARVLAVSGNRELVEELGNIFWRDKSTLWEKTNKDGDARSIVRPA